MSLTVTKLTTVLDVSASRASGEEKEVTAINVTDQTKLSVISML